MPVRQPFSRNRNLQAIVLLLLAMAQIVTARLTTFLHVGEGVEIRSAATAHPLVPWFYAFSIWGVIYLYSLGAAIWQVLPKQKNNRALNDVGWDMAGIYALNSLWQIWVPLHGIDALSCVMIVVSLALGIRGLWRLRQSSPLSPVDSAMVFGPLALVTGWLTAAGFVNITSALVGAHVGVFNPVDANVSLGFLITLIVFGGVIVRLSHSLLYSLALIWALFWIMMGNLYRDHDLTLATAAVIGVVVVAAIYGWTRIQDSHHRSIRA